MLARDYHAELADDVGALTSDPFGFVMYNWPWGVAGTPLADENGPEDWQRDVLQQIGAGTLSATEAIRIAVASGHGIGKSALVAWIILWALATCPDARGVVTANTDTQLRTKTWAELSKWHRMGLVASWFTLTATAIYSSDPKHEKTWRVDAVPWSPTNPESFAGLHNKGRRVLVVFDEASTIADPIWETAEGAMTDADTEIIWCAFGNPTRNTGRFRECFGRFRHRWQGKQIDARTVKLASKNKAQTDAWVADYGEDSDFVRVRVRGVFPRAGSMQFIDSERVEQAKGRQLADDSKEPLVMGVDIARHGDDKSVIRFRRGRDARSIPPVKLRIADLMQLASRIAEEAQKHGAEAVFLDVTGMGWGVFDRLKSLNLKGLVGVDFSTKADRSDPADAGAKYANKRAEIWGYMREWLKQGCIDDDSDLLQDLPAVEYGYNAHNEIQLERKQDMKKRGLASPDDGDALATTFAYPVARGSVHAPRGPRSTGGWMAA